MKGRGEQVRRADLGRLACVVLAGMVCWLFAAGRSAAQTPTTQAPAQTSGEQKPGVPAGAGDNPFPGENADVPILPVGTGAPDAGRPDGMSEVENGVAKAVDPDGDPVRTPEMDNGTDVGFSSSRTGLSGAAAGPVVETTPGKSTKTKTRDEVVKDDVGVGEFYLEKKDWKAALMRFQSAFLLDSESPEAAFGLAEAERHMEMWDKAREHYWLFLSYDPGGSKAKAARKAVDQLEREHPASGAKAAEKP